MTKLMKDLKTVAHEFFAAYDAHEVDGMLALCADGALAQTKTIKAIAIAVFMDVLR